MSNYENGPGNVPRLPDRVVDTLIDSAGVSRCAPGRGINVVDQTANVEKLVHDTCEELLARLPAPVSAPTAGERQSIDTPALDVAFRDAVDAEFPMPDTPHTSVLMANTEQRAAMWRGIMAAQKILGARSAGDAVPADLLRQVLESSVGKRTFWQLSEGIGSEHPEGKAWLAAKAAVDGVDEARRCRAQGGDTNDSKSCGAAPAPGNTEKPFDAVRQQLVTALKSAIRGAAEWKDECRGRPLDISTDPWLAQADAALAAVGEKR